MPLFQPVSHSAFQIYQHMNNMLNNPDRNQHIIIAGQRKTGKSILLRHFYKVKAINNEYTLHLDLNKIKSVKMFLKNLFVQIEDYS